MLKPIETTTFDLSSEDEILWIYDHLGQSGYSLLEEAKCDIASLDRLVLRHESVKDYVIEKRKELEGLEFSLKELFPMYEPNKIPGTSLAMGSFAEQQIDDYIEFCLKAFEVKNSLGILVSDLRFKLFICLCEEFYKSSSDNGKEQILSRPLSFEILKDFETTRLQITPHIIVLKDSKREEKIYNWDYSEVLEILHSRILSMIEVIAREEELTIQRKTNRSMLKMTRIMTALTVFIGLLTLINVIAFLLNN